MTASKTMTTDNPGLHNRRSRRHSGHKRKKRSLFYNIFKWAKKNPTKIIAILFGMILIYVTILFVQYANKHKRRSATTWKMEVKQHSKRHNDFVAFE